MTKIPFNPPAFAERLPAAQGFGRRGYAQAGLFQRGSAGRNDRREEGLDSRLRGNDKVESGNDEEIASPFILQLKDSRKGSQ